MFKSGEIIGKIIKHQPGNMVQVNYAGTILTLPASDNELLEKFKDGGILKAPNGKKSNLNKVQWHLVRTPAFKAWFGDWENDPGNASKVVDENGEPLVLYHGTNTVFNVFKPSGSTGSHGESDQIRGIYFTSNKEVATWFAIADDEKFVKSVFLSAKKPFYAKDIKDLKQKLNVEKDSLIIDELKGYDGLIIEKGFYTLGLNVSYIVFDPKQVKLADGSNLSFDMNNPDIRFKMGGKINNLFTYVGKRIKKILSTEEAYNILDSDAELSNGTWAAGACWPLAIAIKNIAGGELKMIIEKDNDSVQHILVYKDGQYIDADGLQSKGEKLKISMLEGCKHPEIIDFNPKQVGIEYLGKGSILFINNLEKFIKSKLKISNDSLKLGGTVYDDIDEQLGFSISEFVDATQENKPAVKHGRLADYGEKIGGAKKDLFRQLQGITEEDILSQPLSKIFPEPDYKKIVDDGIIRTDDAVLLKYIYENIPPKPRKPYRLANWAAQVNKVIDLYKIILAGNRESNDDYFNLYRDKMMSNEYLVNEIDIYTEILKAFGFPEVNVKLGNFRIKKYNHGYRLNNKMEREPVKNQYTIIEGNSIVKDFDSLEDAINGLKLIINRSKEKTASATKFFVYQDTKTKLYFIGKKGAVNVIRLMVGFQSAKQAFETLTEKQPELQAIWDGMKDIPDERRENNRPRVGVDWRKGRDINTEEFGKTFGFRGVEFGNWVNNRERQDSVNEAYDALMDLAAALNIPPDGLSLSGELAFAFGARGSGKANAHYEPGKVVINLTKTRGSGSVAHEWWHGLDNYFSRMRGIKEGHITESPRYRLDNKTGQPDQSVRHEILDAYKGVVDAINKSKLKDRSLVLDGARSKQYWSTPVEMSARAFENYIIDKLAETGQRNDYLANFKEMADWIGDTKGNIDAQTNYPYPLEDESPAINQAYQQFFDTLKSRKNIKGITQLFESGGIINRKVPKDFDTDLGVEFGQKFKNGDIIVSHGTSSALLPDIFKYGLQPGQNKTWDDSSKGKLFFEIEPTRTHYGDNVYAWKATQKYGGIPVLLYVRVKKSNLRTDRDDAVLGHQYIKNQRECTCSIPAHDIIGLRVFNNIDIKRADFIEFAGIYADDSFEEGGYLDNLEEKMKNFDWDTLYNNAIEELKNNVPKTEEQQRQEYLEELYQNSVFSKKWAATFKEAKTKMLAEYFSAKNSYDEWVSKEYKPNNKAVWVGDEIGGTARSIGSINNRRRMRNIQASKDAMNEAIKDLKQLGLTQQEINEAIGHVMEQGGQLNNEKIRLPKGAKEIFHYSENDLLNELENREAGTWFTDNSYAYERRPGVKGKISKIINPGNLNLATEKQVWEAANGDLQSWALGVKKIKEQGFDGINQVVDGDNHYLIFDLNKLNDKSDYIFTQKDYGGIIDTKNITVRDLASMMNGEVTGAIFSQLEKGDAVKVAGKTYTVTTKTKGTEKEYTSPKGKLVKYKEITIRLKDEKGGTISGKYWEYLNGSGMFFGNRKWEQLSRDMEGDITLDLINENNPFHTPTDSYRYAKEYVEQLNIKQFQEGGKLTGFNGIPIGTKLTSTFKDRGQTYTLQDVEGYKMFIGDKDGLPLADGGSVLSEKAIRFIFRKELSKYEPIPDILYRGQGEINATYGGVSDKGIGTFYTDNKTMAAWFAGILVYNPDKSTYEKTGKAGTIETASVKINNPYIIDMYDKRYDPDNDHDAVQIYFDEINEAGGVENYKSKLKSQGHDCIILKDNTTNYYDHGSYNIYIVFDKDRQFETGGEIEKEIPKIKTGYDARVYANLNWIGTPKEDWRAVPIKGFTSVEGPDGKFIDMPEFDFPKGYKDSKTLYKSNQNSPCCELCGKSPIKIIYWLQNDKQQTTLRVGSECVTHFGEGASGKENLRQAKINMAIMLDNDLSKLGGLIKKEFSTIRDWGYGKKQREWRSAYIGNDGGFNNSRVYEALKYDDFYVLVDQKKAEDLKKYTLQPEMLRNHLDTINWRTVYEKIPVFDWKRELELIKRNYESQESGEKKLLTWFRKNEQIGVDMMIKIIKILKVLGKYDENVYNSEYLSAVNPYPQGADNAPD